MLNLLNDLIYEHLNVELSSVKYVLFAVAILASLISFINYRLKKAQQPEQKLNVEKKCPYKTGELRHVSRCLSIQKEHPNMDFGDELIAADKEVDFLDKQLIKDKLIKEKFDEEDRCGGNGQEAASAEAATESAPAADGSNPDYENFLFVKQSEAIELTSEEREKELELKKIQLEHIFNLLKRQEQALYVNEHVNGCSNQDLADQCETSSSSIFNATDDVTDFKFSILKEDGTYETKEVELKNVFESQLKLYGL